ncbi:hypothetical protein OK348_00410 [Flavobacterium sp. MXW15]|uniref:Uncharacterized protein n=1 Tax=Xanthomonas chitinilytica TaxID=2989819 RepID=A0ABT3JR55_9XANT|nr:hypothetical protein [Xanthomonas sp. H13-6]MCW4453266.1 hypothetical protein [Flavobacterium sp. MXW15]MCW4470979.1 hypothetical protein [Xanthomonas sp. H13-6]
MRSPHDILPAVPPLELLQRLLDDDIDAALDGGLMDYIPRSGDEALDPAHPDLPAVLLQAQQRLRRAWAARERYRARAARLARRAAERDARRAPPPAPDRKPALPPAAAAILARAKARAAGHGQP